MFSNQLFITRMFRRKSLRHQRLLRTFRAREDGMSTAEYAIGTIAAAAFAAVLYAVVTGDSIVTGLTSLIQQALSVQL